MATSLLHYRSWNGTFRPAAFAIWPIARVSLGAILSRRLFWVLYSLSLFIFLMFFFGSFLLGWAEAQISDQPLQLGKINIPPEKATAFIRQLLHVLNGSRETYAFFFGFQGTMSLVVLALTGSVLVGNDLQFRSLPFYLSKPIGRWHYLAGKCLAVGIIVQLLTTLPALVLFAQHSFDDFAYLSDVDFFRKPAMISSIAQNDPGPAGWQLLAGVVGYGMVLSVFLSLLLVTTALWQKRTVALVIVWTSGFVFLRRLSGILVDDLKWPAEWRFLDLWNTMGVLGQACLGYSNAQMGSQPQPEVWQAGLFLLGVSAVCLIYLNRKTRSVEIVR